MPKRKGLTPKEQSFVEEYIKDYNGTQAYIRSKYKDCNAKTASVLACRLLGMHSVQAAIQKRRDKITKRVDINLQKVLLELAKVGFQNTQNFYDEDGALIPIQHLPEGVSAAISGIEHEEIWTGKGEDRTMVGTLKKIKTHSKVEALKELRKHFEGDKLNLGFDMEGIVKTLLDVIKSLPGPDAQRIMVGIEGKIGLITEKQGELS